MPEKGLKYDILQKPKNENLFEYLPIIPSEINSTHPFYPFQHFTQHLICEISLCL